MHLLQSGVDPSVIALWLGHEKLETTHMYVEADLAMKERVLEKLAPAKTRASRFKADDSLSRFFLRSNYSDCSSHENHAARVPPSRISLRGNAPPETFVLPPELPTSTGDIAPSYLRIQPSFDSCWALACPIIGARWWPYLTC